MRGVGFDKHGCGGLIDVSSLSAGEVYVETNAGDNTFLVGDRMFDVFGENTAYFFSANKQVVGPFGLGMNMARAKEVVDSKSGGHGERGDGCQWGIGGMVDGKTEICVWGCDPRTVKATCSVGLIVGGDESPRRDHFSFKNLFF